MKGETTKEVETIDSLLYGVMDTLHLLLRGSVYESAFNEEEVAKRIEAKETLRKALRTCTYGDLRAKKFLKSCILDILIKKYKIDKNSIDKIIPFGENSNFATKLKFKILLYMYREKYGEKAFETIVEEYELIKPKIDSQGFSYYKIDASEIDEIYDLFFIEESIEFKDKINILTQIIYERYKGNGIIDELREMNIDGISGGVSGIPYDGEDNSKITYSYESIWIFYKGKSVYLPFLSFESNKDFIRVCRNIYRYGSNIQLSETKGYIVSEMADGSRISVARPPFSESWVFFIRKFDRIVHTDIDKLLTDKDNHIPIELIKWMIKGCQVISITGEQGSGKTTLLMALIQFINPSYNLRILEMAFELQLRKMYPERNIVTFRETPSITGQEGLDFQKKTDGTVSILGEVAEFEVANWFVQMSMAASLFTLFTHHGNTTDHLIRWLRNALLQAGGFQNEKIAQEQVTDVLNFDIHMKKTGDGHRYIERITEIIPNITEGKGYILRDIVIYDEGKYILKNIFSDQGIDRIKSHLTKEEKETFTMDLLEKRRCLY